MKRLQYIYIAILLFAGIQLQAQIPMEVQVQITPPYPKEYSYWFSNASGFFITAINNSDIDLDCYVQISIESLDGETFIRFRDDFIPSRPFTIPANSARTFSAEVVANNYDNLDIGGLDISDDISLDINGELPAGEYIICAQLIEFPDNPAEPPVYLSPQAGCSDPFEINQGNIELIHPYDGDVLPADVPISFNWINNSLTALDSEHEYRLRLYELDSLTAANESIYDLVETGSLPAFFTSNPSSDIFYLYDYTLGEIPLTDGFLYAAQVEVVDDGNMFFENDGRSNIASFWYEHDPNSVYSSPDPEITEAQSDCFENCHFTLDSNEQPTSATELESISVGHFTMDELEFTSSNNGIFSGTGRIQVEWLNDVFVKTTFNNITVNTDGRLIDGEVNADVADDVPYLIEQIYNGVNTTRLVAGILGSETTLDLPLGLDQSIGGTSLLIALTSMKWDATTAYVGTACNFQIPAMGETWISLESSETCMHPGGFGNEFTLHMGYDTPVNIGGDVTVSFKGSASDDNEDVKQEACYIEMDCNGAKALSIKADISFPRGMIVPDTPDGTPGEGQVTGGLGFTVERAVNQSENVYYQLGGDTDVPFEEGLHFLAKIEIDSFQIKNLEGWALDIEDMWYDASELSNVPNMVYPETHEDVVDGELLNIWTGFYLEKGKILCPKEFLGGGARASADISNGMIDPALSVNISVNQLFPIDEGNVDGWALSMDSLFISIENNALTEGGFSGQIGMPIVKEQQFLRYTATITEPEGEENNKMQYIMNVSPEENLSMPIFLARAELMENSYVDFKFQPGSSEGTYFETMLAGGMFIGSDELDEEEIDEEVDVFPFELSLVEFAFKYNSKDGFSDEYFALLGGVTLTDNEGESSGDGGLDFSNMGYGTEARKENFLGMPLALKKMDIKAAQTEGDFEFVIEPEISLSPGTNGFAAATKIALPSSMEGTEIKTLKLQGFRVDAVEMDIDVMGFQFGGMLEFYNEKDPEDIGEKGAKGEFNVNLPLGIGMKMAAEFGSLTTNQNAEWNTSQNYPYWYFDGMAYFGENGGIPVAGPIGLYGIGGGISYNMSRSSYENDIEGAISEINIAEELANGNDVDVSTLRRTSSPPTANYGSYGLKMAGTIATCPIAAALNMDVSIQSEFSGANNLTLSLLSIDGDAYLMTPLGDRSKPKVWAGVGLTFENPSPGQYAFDGTVDAYVNVFGLLRGAGAEDLMGNVHLHASNFTGTNAKGEPAGKWYLHIGDPDNRCGLKVGFEGLSEMRGTGYFMLGHDLPTDLPLPDRVADLFGETNKKSGNKLSSGTISSSVKRSSSSTNNAKKGTGLALGLETEAGIDIDALGIYAKLGVFMGFDINVTQNPALYCSNTGEQIGVNGWYGQGQIYGGLEGGLGFRFRFLGKDHDLELFGLKAAMMLSGGGPNPFYADGRVGLQIRVLGGLVTCQKTIGVEVGEKCIPQYGNPFGGVPIIAETFPTDGDEDVSHFAQPNVLFTFPVDEVTHMVILDDEGDPEDYYVKPVYTNVRLTRDDGQEIAIEDEKILKSGKMLKLVMESSFESNHEYEMSLTIKAKEYPNGPDGNSKWVKEYGQVWSQDTTIVFSVGELTNINDGVAWSVPMDGQKYFLQDEVYATANKVTLVETQSEAFKQNNSDYDYEYFVRYLSEDNDEHTIIELNNPGSAETLDWDLPEFDNNTHYCMQLIRKAIPKTLAAKFASGPIQIQKDFKLYDSNNEVESRDTLNLGNSYNPVNDLGFGEVALITHFFKTSKYDLLEEKINTTGHDWYPVGDKLIISANERLDKFDVKGRRKNHELVLEPLVRIFDPMELESRTSLNIGTPYTSYYDDEVDGKVVRLIDNWDEYNLHNPYELPELEIDYTGDLQNQIHKQVLNYDSKLDESVVDKFAESTFNNMIASSVFFDIDLDGSIATSIDPNVNNIELYFDTFDKVKEDAETLYEWADVLYYYNSHGYYIFRNDIVSKYSKFKTHYDALYHYMDFSCSRNRPFKHYIDFYHGQFRTTPIDQFRGYSKIESSFVND